MAGEPADANRPRYDWSARVRSTTFDAARYTRFVWRMKRLLSFSAFAVIFAVLAFFVVQRAPRELSLSFDKVGTLENDLAMTNPRLSGTDAKGNPFVITAKEAVQDADNAKRYTLRAVEADMNTPEGWLNARAGQGILDMAAQTMDLGGGIALFTDNGYELHTSIAAVDLRTNTVRGSQPVTGQGPMGAMRADTFQYDRDAGLLTLEGRVNMTMSGNRQ